MMSTLCFEYIVFTAEMAGLEDLVKHSVSVVVLLTGGLVEDARYRILIDTILDPDCDHNCNIVFIVLEKQWREAWEQYEVQ